MRYGDDNRSANEIRIAVLHTDESSLNYCVLQERKEPPTDALFDEALIERDSARNLKIKEPFN